MFYSHKTKILFVSLLSIFLLTGFGCKNNEETPEETPADQQTQEQPSSVTFNVTDATGNDASLPDSSTSDSGFSNQDQSDSDSGSDDSSNSGDDVKNTETPVDTPSDSSSSSSSNSGSSTDGASNIDLSFVEQVVEIYGSFTNKSQEPYKNLSDIEVYATDSFKSWITDVKSNPQDSSGGFYGITTEAISSAVLESTPKSATILITTEREEVTEQNQSGRKFYALIVANLIQQDDEWLVNGLYWQ